MDLWGIYTWLGWSGEVAEPIGSGVPVRGRANRKWYAVRSHHFLLALPLPCSNPTSYKYPTHSIHWHTSFTCLWRWNRQWVPKRRQLELRRRGITQKGTSFSSCLLFVLKDFSGFLSRSDEPWCPRGVWSFSLGVNHLVHAFGFTSIFFLRFIMLVFCTYLGKEL